MIRLADTVRQCGSRPFVTGEERANAVVEHFAASLHPFIRPQLENVIARAIIRAVKQERRAKKIMACKRYLSLDDRREFSGLDHHTIFVDPLYKNVSARDFGLDEKSPNDRAGTNGKTIGALEN